MALIQSNKDSHYLTFDDKKHKYILDGKRVPGVTTFTHGGYPTSEALVSWMKGQTGNAMFEALTQPDQSSDAGFYPKESLWPISTTQRKEIIKEAKSADKKSSEAAANIGTLTHDFAYFTETKQYDKLLETQKAIASHIDKDKILACTLKFTEWSKTHADEMVASETIVASLQHSFGGKFDRLAKRDGKLILSDFKTSGSIYVDQYIQLAAYRIAIREWMGLEVEGLEVL